MNLKPERIVAVAMGPKPARFPFAGSATRACWPADIPRGARQVWEDSRQNFSAEWRIPLGTGFDELRVTFPRHQLVLVVASGAIRLSYGAREVPLVAGQAVAVSVPEVVMRDFSPCGESVFILHLIHRMPTLEELGEGGGLAAILAERGAGLATHVAGLFPYWNASLLLQPGPYSAVLPRNGADLVNRMWLCGLEPTARFLGCGRKEIVEVVTPSLRRLA